MAHIITEKYKALQFDENYWKYQSNISCIDDIFLELYTLTMKFKTIKHFQDNIINSSQLQQDHGKDIILNQNWWISNDYFDDNLEEESKALKEFFFVCAMITK